MVYERGGILGFYRCVLPPFFGSIIYRSLQFSTFETVYTKAEDHESLKRKIPFTGGVQVRVIIGGICSATVRAVIECPFEYAKVKRQTGQQWAMSEGYTGFRILYTRTLGLMTSFFIIVDSMRRHTNIFKTKIGQFFGGGLASTMGFWVVWPFEVLKNQAQAGNKDFGGSTWERAQHIYNQQGIRGFTRGIVPGSQSIFLRNGCAMVVMQYGQRKLTEWGFRD